MKYPLHRVSQSATGATARRIIRAVESGRAVTNKRARATFTEIAAGWKAEAAARAKDYASPMTAVSIRLPQAVLQKARVFAEAEGLPLELVLSIALVRGIEVWTGESYVTQRARCGSRAAFDAALAQVPDALHMPGDELEPSKNNPGNKTNPLRL